MANRPNPLIPVIVNVKSLGINMPENYTRIFGLVSIGDTNLTTGTIKSINKNSLSEVEIKTNSYTSKFITSFFANNPNGQFNILEAGEVEDDNVDNQVALLKQILDEGNNRTYEWAVPTEFFTNTNFISLVNSYSGVTAGQYFSIEVPETLDKDTINLYNKSKSICFIYPSPNTNEAVNGAIVGIKAGTLYDLSVSNPLSPLQWKMVNGITVNDNLSDSDVSYLNNNGFSWVGSFNRNTVILGGITGDNKNWDYYYALDTMIFRLTADLGAMMIKGANSPLQAVRFNQQGIDVIKSKLVAICNNLVNYYVLSEFGANYDSINNAIVDKGEWLVVDYPTYKAAEYENWSLGIYNGASMYATIGSFVLQIKPNITIE